MRKQSAVAAPAFFTFSGAMLSNKLSLIYGDPASARAKVASLAAHVAIVALLVSPLMSLLVDHQPPGIGIRPGVLYFAVGEKPRPLSVNGGGNPGGGGHHDPLPPMRGRLPSTAEFMIVGPTLRFPNPHPNLPTEMTIQAPPEILLPNVNAENIGDPRSLSRLFSQGPGEVDGFGKGRGRGIGNRNGPGFGEQKFGTGVGVAGKNGFGTPICEYCPNPPYPEEARRVKYQGVVVMEVIVGADGRVAAARVVSSPGLGMDGKAVETVRNWHFRPALGPAGKPTAVSVLVEVTFRLL